MLFPPGGKNFILSLLNHYALKVHSGLVHYRVVIPNLIGNPNALTGLA
jgi:hypothetical protein